MFEHLESIDWPHLETAYGTAEAIPGALRDLTSPDEEKRGMAWQTLTSELEHQGTIYQASAYAAPFLVAWLPQVSQDKQADLVTFLAVLARGNSYKRQHLNLTDEQRKQDPVFQREMAEEIRWVELTHQAVRDGMDLYLTFLQRQDMAVRMATTYLLACFPEDQERLVTHLRSCLEQETDERMTSCLLLSLGKLLPGTEASSALLTSYLPSSISPLVRFTAAQALSFLLKQAVPEEVVAVFFSVLTEPTSVLPVYDDLPWTWAGMAPHFQAFRILRRLTRSRHHDLIMQQFLALLPTLDEIMAEEVADHLLHTVFQWEEMELPPKVIRENLTPEQRAILQAIAARDDLWEVKYHVPGVEVWSGIRQDLRFLNLPTTQQDLLAFLHDNREQERTDRSLEA